MSLYSKNLFTSSASTPSTPSFYHHFRFSSLRFPGFSAATILPHLPCLHIHTYLRYLPFLGCGTVRGNPPLYSHLQCPPVWFFFSFLLTILRTFRLTHLISIFSLAWVNCLLPSAFCRRRRTFGPGLVAVVGRCLLPYRRRCFYLCIFFICSTYLTLLDCICLLVFLERCTPCVFLSSLSSNSPPPCLAFITLREKSKKKKIKKKVKKKNQNCIHHLSINHPSVFFSFPFPTQQIITLPYFPPGLIPP